MGFDQAAYDVRCEWGLPGIAALAPGVDVLVIVDVLSFSTCVEIATTRGAVILPYGWRDQFDTPALREARALLAALA